MSLNETLVEEELSSDSCAEHASNPRQFPSKDPSDSNHTDTSPRSDISPESVCRRLRSPREAALVCMAGRDGGGSLSGACSSDEETRQQEGEGHGTQPEAETEVEEVEAFPAPSSVTHLTSTKSKSHQNGSQSPSQTLSSSLLTSNTNNNHPTNPSRTSLALALQGQHIPIPLTSQTRPDLLPPPTSPPPSSSSPPGSGRGNRAMADALGDQSDAEVTEEDEEMGIKRRQRGEEEMILADERRERSEALFSERGMAAAAMRDDVY